MRRVGRVGQLGRGSGSGGSGVCECVRMFVLEPPSHEVVEDEFGRAVAFGRQSSGQTHLGAGGALARREGRESLDERADAHRRLESVRVGEFGRARVAQPCFAQLTLAQLLVRLAPRIGGGGVRSRLGCGGRRSAACGRLLHFDFLEARVLPLWLRLFVCGRCCRCIGSRGGSGSIGGRSGSGRGGAACGRRGGKRALWLHRSHCESCCDRCPPSDRHPASRCGCVHGCCVCVSPHGGWMVAE